MEAAKMASPKSAPKDAQVMAQILKDMGITEYEPRVINQMLEFAYKELSGLMSGCQRHKSGFGVGTKRVFFTSTSVVSALEEKYFLCWEVLNASGRGDFLVYSEPFPHCLVLSPQVSSTAGRITVPRLSVGAVSSRPSTPTLGTPSAQTVSVSAKVGAPVSLAGQRFTVQIPSSQPAGKSGIPGIP
ncbi:TAF9 factor, partial [Donacobius atricapilla]|nr:TAF9 factor [Donacobius atricapilla]